MRHLDEGTLLAIRDGAYVSAGARRHAEGCSVCDVVLRDARDRAAIISHTLDSLATTPDVGVAKARVRARIDAQMEAERTWRPWRLPWTRAAIFLLLAAGAAYAASPGSPLMQLIRGNGVTVEAPSSPSASQPAGQEAGRTGIEVDLPEAGLVISLTGVASGAEVEVVWIDEPVARISATEGSTYALADGRAQAAVAPGPVLIEVFEDVSSLLLEINGRVVMNGSGEAPLLLEGTGVRTPNGLVFDVQGR